MKTRSAKIGRNNSPPSVNTTIIQADNKIKKKKKKYGPHRPYCRPWRDLWHDAPRPQIWRSSQPNTNFLGSRLAMVRGVAQFQRLSDQAIGV